MQLLLEYENVDRESQCMYGRTPLSWAAGIGHVTTVEILLKRGADVNSRSKFGRTPLTWAAMWGREAVVKLLLQQEGIHVNTRDDYWNYTPLHYAAENGHEAVVRLLLENAADAEAKDNRGRTPLDCAIYNRSEEIILLLKSRIHSS